MKFGKKRSAPEPEPIDITERLSILDLRDSARPGAAPGSAAPPAAGAPAASESDALPGRVVWKPTIYQPPAPGTAAPADVVAEAVTAPQPVVAAAPPVAAPTPVPAETPAYAPPPALANHHADAARYEAEAFELPSFVPPPVEPEAPAAPVAPDVWDQHEPTVATMAEPPVAYDAPMTPEATTSAPPPVDPGAGAGEPAHEPWTHHEPTPLEPAAPAYDVPIAHGITTAELPPFEPQSGAGEPAHAPWTEHAPTRLEPAYPQHEEPTPLEPTAHTSTYAEREAQVPDARAEDESREPVEAASAPDLTEPVPTVPEQVVDLTEAPEPVHAAVVEALAANNRRSDDDGVIRWTW